MNTDIEALIFKAYHGELTDQERDLLSQWVMQSPEHARLVVEYAAESRGIEIVLRSDQAAQARETIGSMDQVFQNIDGDVMTAMMDNTLASRRSHEEKMLAEQLRAPGWGNRATLAVAAFLGIAALTGIAFWLGGLGPAPDRQEQTELATPNPVAPRDEQTPGNLDPNPRVADVFDSDLIYFTNGDGDHRNQMGDMPFGFAAYTFWKRGTIVIAGPAQWQMLKGDAIRLFDGLLVARAEQDAYEPLSFLIDGTEIRVQGAEFGVYRTGADTAIIIVFAGSIEFSLVSAGEQSLVQTMDAGQIGVLQTRLGTVEQQSSSTQDDLVHFSPAIDRLRYRPLRKTNSVYYRHNITRSLYYGVYDYPQYTHKACLSRESVNVIVAEGDLAALERDPSGMAALSAGQAVDSYLLHFDPAVEEGQADTMVEGMITFDRPILAVLGSSDSIRATDTRYGSPATAYPRSSETAGGPAGSESWGIELADDEFELSEDRKRLTFRFHAGKDIDQVRILVEAW